MMIMLERLMMMMMMTTIIVNEIFKFFQSSPCFVRRGGGTPHIKGVGRVPGFVPLVVT